MFSNSQDKNKKVKVEETSNYSNLGKGASIDGNIETIGNIRIDSNVKGNVTCKAKIVLGPSSYVEGTVVAQNAEIEGEIQGSIEVTELLILRPTSVIHGDIVTNKLVVESGATFNGSCRMGVSVNEITFDNESARKTTIESTPEEEETESRSI